MATVKEERDALAAENASILEANEALRKRIEEMQAQTAPQSLGEVDALRARITELESGSSRKQATLEDVRATVGADCDSTKASTLARWRIMIPRTGAPGETPEQKVSVNGRMYQIQRAVNVDVPPEVVLALADAIVSTPVKNEQDQVLGYTDAPRIPFAIIGLAVSADGQRLLA